LIGVVFDSEANTYSESSANGRHASRSASAIPFIDVFPFQGDDFPRAHSGIDCKPDECPLPNIKASNGGANLLCSHYGLSGASTFVAA